MVTRELWRGKVAIDFHAFYGIVWIVYQLIGETMTIVINNARDINGNVGDATTDPTAYFGWLTGATHLQIDRVALVSDWRLRSSNVIVGGGGLIDSLPLFELGMKRIAKAVTPKRSVIWGAGVNKHGRQNATGLPAYLDDFGLVGLRDRIPGYESRCIWTPCPSVLLPALHEHRLTPREHDFIVFENWQKPTGIKDPGIPRIKNNRRFRSQAVRLVAAGEIIAKLATADTIVTSSYHGVVWGTWLGRKVVVPNAFSSKFGHLWHPPVFSDPQNWRSAAKRAQAYPGAYKMSLQAANAFAGRVREHLGL